MYRLIHHAQELWHQITVSKVWFRDISNEIVYAQICLKSIEQNIHEILRKTVQPQDPYLRAEAEVSARLPSDEL